MRLGVGAGGYGVDIKGNVQSLGLYDGVDATAIQLGGLGGKVTVDGGVRVAGAITVALLSALTVMNTFAAGTALVIDARLAALGVAALALWLRLPFLLVVVLGAAAAGLVRWWG